MRARGRVPILDRIGIPLHALHDQKEHVMYTHILVAVDGSAASRFALTEAINLARSCNAHIRAVFVIDTPFWLTGASYYDPAKLKTAIEREGDTVLREVQAEFDRAGLQGSTEKVATLHAGDDVAHRIQAVADARNANVIVIGTHGRRGFQKMLIGSVADRLMRISNRPTLLVRVPAGVE
jgi:nucleotide-binding universal stress UspA family protein